MFKFELHLGTKKFLKSLILFLKDLNFLIIYILAEKHF